MKKTQQIEVIGIGKFDIYPIKAVEQKYPMVNLSGEEVFKQQVTKSIPSIFKFVDKKGKEYDKTEVFYQVLDNRIQQIKRTEKISRFEIVNKDEIYNLSESSFSVLNCDETTKRIFDEKVKNQAISFNIKKSTIGFKFHKAFVLKMFNELVMMTGLGDIKKAITQFKKSKTAKTQTEVILQKVEVRADDLIIQI